MRYIDKLIIHCSDSSNPEHDNIETIRKWHKERGFTDVGYHFFIRSGGTVENGRPIGHIGAHCEKHNKTSVGICLHGKDKFTLYQMQSLARIIKELLSQLKLSKDRVYPHHHFNAGKTCPNFDVAEFISKYL